MPNTADELEKLLDEYPEARDELLRIVGKFRETSRSRKAAITQSVASPRSDDVVVPVEFDIPPVPSDFRGVDPGSRMWIRYWREHPEQQSEMLAYVEERRINQ